MKKKWYHTLGLFVLVTILVTTILIEPMIAKADGAATFQNGMLVLTPEGIHGANPDFFKDYTKNLLPGDDITFTVQVKNNSSERVKFYFWAGDTENGKVISDELLSLIHLRITRSDNRIILYEGPAHGKGTGDPGSLEMIGTGAGDGIDLGWLNAGNNIGLNITISIPTSMGNEYQSEMASVDWTFLCEVYVPPTNPPTDPPTDPPITPPTDPPITPPTESIPEGDIDIEEDDIPEGAPEDESLLENIPEEDIPDDSIPEGVIVVDDKDLGKLPQTGTLASVIGNSIGIGTGVLLICVLCILYINREYIKKIIKKSSE